MTPKKKKPAKRGRKPIEDSLKLEQLTIRLPQKLKFGLDLLARAQHRSLSQAVEWALLVGLNGYRVNNEWESVAGLLDKAWANDEPFDRLHVIYNAAPDLLSFEDRAGCEAVDRSYESELSNAFLGHAAYLPSATTAEEQVAQQTLVSQLEAQRRSIFLNFVRTLWPRIRTKAVERANAGKSHEGVSLQTILDLRDGLTGWDDFTRMQGLTEFFRDELNADDVPKRFFELEQQFPWARKHGVARA